MKSLDRIIEALEMHGSKVRKHAGYIVAQCPTHHDTTPSLSLKQTDDRTLLKCFAGCDTNHILETIGLSMRDSYDQPIDVAPVVNMADYLLKQTNIVEQPIETTTPTNEPIEYIYYNENWEPVAKTIKTIGADGKKTFRQHRHINNMWIPGLNGFEPPLYELPVVLDAIANNIPIFIVEGEKDADTINNMQGLNAVATTAPMGAGKWRQQHTQQLFGAKNVCIIHDNDEPGINHAINIQTQLNEAGITTRILTPKTGKDTTDHFNAGHGINDFIDASQQIQEAQKDQEQKQLQKAINEERIKQTARETVRKEITETNAANRYQLPTYTQNLTDELQQPDEQTQYIINDLWPTGANISLTATYKAGKTSTINNIIKALADQQPLFGHFQTNHTGRIAYFNYEVSPNQMRRWLRETNITNEQLIQIIHMRGHTWPLTSDYVIKQTIELLATNNITTLILDPLARAFIGSGDENSNQDVGIFLDTLDYIKDQAGVANLLIAAHTGRNAEQGNSRARGASRFDDWVDARWMLSKDTDGQRWFSADGRDVSLDESRLDWDDTNRTQKIALGIGKKQTSIEQTTARVYQIIYNAGQTGINKTGIISALKAAYGEESLSNESAEGGTLGILRDNGMIYMEKIGNSKLFKVTNNQFQMPID